MLDKVEALLEQAGSDKEHMLSVTIYLKDMKDFQRNERSMGRMGSLKVTHQLVHVWLAIWFREALLVEISVIVAWEVISLFVFSDK